MPPPGSKAIEAVGPTGAQPQFLGFDLATVIYAVPALNAYYVIPSQNMSGAGDPVMEIAYSMNGACLRFGAMLAEVYQPGTRVIIGRTGVAADRSEVTGLRTTFILGAVPEHEIKEVTNYQCRFIMPGQGLNYFSTPFADSLKQAHPDTTLLADRSFGRPTELLAGDWGMFNDAAGHFLLTSMYASMGHLRARIESHGLHNILKTTADDLRVHTLLTEEGTRPDLAGLLRKVRTARSIKEAMGAVTGQPVKLEDGRYVLAEQGQVGVFRRELLEGELVGGLWESYQIPEAVSVRTGVPARPPLGVQSAMTMYSGLAESRSADQIITLKGPYVPVARELVPEDPGDDLPPGEAAPDWQQAKGVAAEDYSHAAPVNTPEELDYNNAGSWRSRLRARTDNWKVHTPEDIEDEYGLEMDRRTDLEPLPETDGEYGLPPYVEVKDPAGGPARKYYPTESFIRQLPDGSISISDGHGAELRMVRGKLILTAAADIEVRPGRDLHMLAPRHVAVNAGANLFMQATKGSAYIKADHDLRVLGGNDSQGTVIIESRGTQAGPPHSNDSEHRLEGGLVIKSASNLGMVGTDMYIGVYDKADKGTTGLARKKKGNIIIDSCGGLTGLLGGGLYGNFTRDVALVCSAQGGRGSALTLGQGNATLLASHLYLGTGNCLVNAPSSGAVQVRTLGPEGVAERSVSVFGRPILSVGGSVLVQESVTAGGSMGASKMYGGSASFGGATKHYSHGGGASPSVSVPALPVATLEQASNTFKNEVEAVLPKNLYKGAHLAGSGFGYPSSADLGIAGCRIHIARWQAMLGPDHAQTWEDRPVRSADDSADTSIYPGREAWAAGGTYVSYFMGVMSAKALDGGYSINTQQEEWNE